MALAFSKYARQTSKTVIEISWAGFGRLERDDPSVGLPNQLRVDVGVFDVFSVFVAKGNEPAPVLCTTNLTSR